MFMMEENIDETHETFETEIDQNTCKEAFDTKYFTITMIPTEKQKYNKLWTCNHCSKSFNSTGVQKAINHILGEQSNDTIQRVVVCLQPTNEMIVAAKQRESTLKKRPAGINKKQAQQSSSPMVNQTKTPKSSSKRSFHSLSSSSSSTLLQSSSSSSSSSQENGDWLLLEMLVINRISPDIVNNEAFKKFVKYLQSDEGRNFNIPERTGLTSLLDNANSGNSSRRSV